MPFSPGREQYDPPQVKIVKSIHFPIEFSQRVGPQDPHSYFSGDVYGFYWASLYLLMICAPPLGATTELKSLTFPVEPFSLHSRASNYFSGGKFSC